MPVAPTRFREEGVGQVATRSDDWRNGVPLTVGEISGKLRKYFGRYTKHFQENERVYANARVAKGLSPKPRYLVSEEGITNNNGITQDRFTWTYLPPVAGAYSVTPKGVIRPWTYIFLHSFGYTWDSAQMGVGKGRRGLRSRLSPPGDEWGHNPTRWFAGVKELTKNPDLTRGKARKVSIHFCISRRGDVLVSADLNDKAWHGGGTLLSDKGNNFVSVGFELEPQLIRLKAGGPLYVAPFPQPQMLALAVVCKKLETFRPIKRVYITKKTESSVSDFANTQRLAQENLSGYVQHSDVSPVYTNKQGKKRGGKVDAAAQFNILPGNKARIGSDAWNGTGLNPDNGSGEYVGSGWTELWGYMDRVRNFRAADQLFIADVPDLDFSLMTDFAQALQKSNEGQSAAMRSMQDKIGALQRASRLQSRGRKATYAKAMRTSTALNDTVATLASDVGKSTSGFDTSDLKAPAGDVQYYNAATGTWFVGGVDTGKA